MANLVTPLDNICSLLHLLVRRHYFCVCRVSRVQGAEPVLVKGGVQGETVDLNRRKAAAALREGRCCFFSRTSRLLLLFPGPVGRCCQKSSCLCQQL